MTLEPRPPARPDLPPPAAGPPAAAPPEAAPPEAAPPVAAQPAAGPDAGRSAVRHQRVALVDLLDRVLASGVVVTGDVTLSIADVDLVTISLRALVSSVRATDLIPGLAEEGPGQ